MKIELTSQQEDAVRQGRPVEIVDAATQRSYLVIAKDAATKLKRAVAGDQLAEANDNCMSSGMQRSQRAFLRDLPEMLKNQRHDRWFVLYHGDVCIRMARNYEELLRECRRRGFASSDCYIGIIRHYEPEPEEIEHLPSDYDDGV